MKNNSIIWGVLILVFIIIGVVVWRFYPSSDQNMWTCANGQWTAVGNPQTPMPTTPCSTNVQQSTSTQTVGSSTVSLVLQPKQCTTEPWLTWYKEGNIKFIQAPTDEQLIKAYYSQKYGINIISVNRSDTGKATCQACNSCAKDYVFTVEVNPGDVAKLTSLGWVNVSEKQ